MAWFKVDDSFWSSPKVMAIPRASRMACLGLWVTAGTWSAQHLTDGRIPSHMLDEWGANVSHGDTLVTSGLWERDNDGYAFHDWSDYQPTRTNVLAGRESERRRKEEWRAKNRGNKGQSPSGTDSRGDNASEQPDPTRPDPTHKDSSKDESARKRGSRIPDIFVISDDMRVWAKENVPLVDIDLKLPEFIDYWRSVPGQKGVKLDWVATWHNGMRKQQEFAERDRPKRRTPANIPPGEEWRFA